MTDVLDPDFREATAADADDLTMLERSANLEALAQVFPPAQYPFPTEDVRDRWRQLLRDPSVHIGIAEDDFGLAVFVAFDDEVLRHLAVRPDRWGSGLAACAVTWALERAPLRRLWCLERNPRALAFYRRLGWAPTGRRRHAEFPPYPDEVELGRRGDATMGWCLARVRPLSEHGLTSTTDGGRRIPTSPLTGCCHPMRTMSSRSAPGPGN